MDLLTLSDADVDAIMAQRHQLRGRHPLGQPPGDSVGCSWPQPDYAAADTIRDRLLACGVVVISRDGLETWQRVSSQGVARHGGQCRRWCTRWGFCGEPVAVSDGSHSQSQSHWCPVHQTALTGRIPCPFEPRHHVRATKLGSHLRVCQSKPGRASVQLPAPPVEPNAHDGSYTGPGTGTGTGTGTGSLQATTAWQLGAVCPGINCGPDPSPNAPAPLPPTTATTATTIATVTAAPPSAPLRARLVPGSIEDDSAAIAAACNDLHVVQQLADRVATALADPALADPNNDGGTDTDTNTDTDTEPHRSDASGCGLPSFAHLSPTARKHAIQHAAIARHLSDVSGGALILCAAGDDVVAAAAAADPTDGVGDGAGDGARVGAGVVVVELCAGYVQR